MVDKDKNEIKFGNMDYSIYTIGDWDNEYKLNVTGRSKEIPASNPTKKHVLYQMKQIRNAVFDWKNVEVNGMVGLGLQFNKELRDLPVNELIELEKKEYENICEEIENLKLKDDNESIKLENDTYLIYKLEMEHDGMKPSPANSFTEEFHKKEIEELKGKL